MTKLELITDLKSKTADCIIAAEHFQSLSVKDLNQRRSSDSWSVLACLEHLNLYGDFYLIELEQKILNAKPQVADDYFKSGWFGERTVTSMLPKDDHVDKMKTFQSKDPGYTDLDIKIIDRFLKQQHQLMRLLDMAEQVDISSITTRITLPLIRFKLGTTFRFVVYHNVRHIWQAKNTLKLINM
jgi:hypothetical protein